MVSVALQSQALRGQDYCGDQGAYWWLTPHQLLVCLVDGIGHGRLAYEAALHCLSIVERFRSLPINDIMNYCNDSLRKTRGVAAALCKWDLSDGEVEFIGVGNIRTSVVGSQVLRLESTPGILGNEPHLTLAPQIVCCRQGQESLFLCSDGVRGGIPYQRYIRQTLYPNLNAVLDELLGEWGCIHDDAAIMAVR